MSIRVGITSACYDGKHTLDQTFTKAIWEAGGVPFILPASQSLAGMHLDHLDGIVLSGGGDLDPWLYGQEPEAKLGRVSPERDTYELELLREAEHRKLPVLGICRGMQAIAVAFGGSLHQDLRTEVKHAQEAPAWYPTHGVKLAAGSRLHAILGETAVRVNSFHHQAVNRVPSGFAATAFALDGVIEAIESDTGSWILGLQWHPETMVERYPVFGKLFRALVEKAGNRA